MSLEAFKKKTIYHAIMLGAFALIASGMLASGAIVTGPEIELRLQEDLTRSLSQVVPADIHDNQLLANFVELKNQNDEIVTVYRATKQGEIQALAYQMHNDEGYSGRILIVMGVKSDGEILGVRVLSHAETPGLGDKIEVQKDDWIFGFDGLSLANTPLKDWGVKKDGGVFDQFSGATITPRAVVKAVKSGLDFFETNKHVLLATGAPEAEATINDEVSE